MPLKGLLVIKTFLKLILCIILYAAVFIAASAVMPFSQSMKEMGSSDDPFLIPFMLVYCACVCFTMYFIIRHANSKGMRLFLSVVFVMFFVQSFMMHVETLFFGSTFYAATKSDVILLMLAGLLPIIATVPLLIKAFQPKKDLLIRNKINYKNILVKLGVIGIVYLCSYILLGFLMTWIFEDFVTHYGEAIANTPNVYLNVAVQVLRGILYGVFIIPLLGILDSKREFILSVCMVYLCTGAQLIIPNELFPESLRYVYLLEMTGAMLLFGIIVGNILWKDGKIRSE